MIYKLTQDVIVLSTGFSRDAGQNIGRGEVHTELLAAWLTEGIAVPVDAVPAPKPVKEEAPLPPESGASPDNKIDKQLRDLPDHELRAMAKANKLRGAHNMKRETMIKRLEELS